MERAAPELAQFATEQIVHAPHHFAGGLVGEREQQNPVRRNPLLQQIGHAIGQRPRLARTRARDDQGWTRRCGDGRVLLGIQFRRVIDLQLDRGGELFQHVVTRHAREVREKGGTRKEICGMYGAGGV